MQDSWHIEYMTKCRRPFQSNFVWNVSFFFISDFTEVFSNKQLASSESDNGSMSIRTQAIIWTNGDLIYWRIYAPPGLSEPGNY